MAASLAALSASVTRILSLTGFPKELKTKDIHAAFSEWETLNGGFKIKWLDDTSLLLVFQDPIVAKRAYLHALAYPPPSISSRDSDRPAVVKPYDGPDAQNIINTVNTRPHGRAHGARASSISVPNHGRVPSVAANPRYGTGNTNGNGNAVNNSDREPSSPTLPNLPNQPTLSALIGDSIPPSEGANGNGIPIDPAILASSAHPDGVAGGPRIGDPGKRMLGHALGVRHPGLTPRAVNGEQGMKDVQRQMAGLTVAE